MSLFNRLAHAVQKLNTDTRKNWRRVLAVTAFAGILFGMGAATLVNIKQIAAPAFAPNQNPVYLSPNCGNQSNCYFAYFDVQITWGCTYSTSSYTIHCPNAVFTSADVGKSEFATNIGRAGNGSAVSSYTTIPLGTITSVTDSTDVVVSVEPAYNSTAGYDSFQWGHPDGSNINTAWHAAANACTELVLPAGLAFTNRGQFNYEPSSGNDCTANTGNGASKHGPSVRGEGMSTTELVITPDFSFTTGTGNSCDAPGGNGGCFLSTYDQMNAHDFSIYGAGLNLSSPGILIYIACDNCSLHDMNLSSFEGGTGTYGLDFSGSFGVINHVIVDGWGNYPCAISIAMISNSYCGDSGNINTLGSTYPSVPMQSVLNEFQGETQITGNVHSSADAFYGTGTSVTSGRPLIVNGGTAVVENADIYNAGSGGGVIAETYGGGTLHLQGSTLRAANSGTTGIYISSSTDRVFDDCGNSLITSATPLNNAGSGTFIGSCSISGTAPTSSNISLGSGFGSSTVGSFKGGDQKHFNFTLSVSGTQSQSTSTITYTFPTAFWMAPASCHVIDQGGTNPFINFLTTTAPTTTAVTFTAQSAATASDTLIVAIDCQ